MSFLWPTQDDHHLELLEAARRGDRGAFLALYRDLYPLVAGFVGRRICHRQDAEDVIAIVFNKFLERLGSYDAARGTVRMFAVAIARTAVIDHVRAVRDDLPVDELSGVLADSAETPLEALLRDERTQALRGALLELSAASREVLILRYGDGLKHGEIAALLGLRPDAVKQRASRALRELEAKLKEGRALDGQIRGEGDRAEGVGDVRI